ncbi:MAG: AI-2E family transporter [Candidatus Aminicenantes bacterium]|nr:AI-2E family transporter [Candidatus Aminicenantes bacterium]
MSKENKALTIAAWIVAAAVLGFVFKTAEPVLFPLFLALFIYFILAPVQDFLMRIKLSRTLSLILVILFAFVILYLMALLFYTSGKALASDLPDYGNKLKELIEGWSKTIELPGGGEFDPMAWAKTLDIGKVGTFLLNSIGTFVSILSTIFLVLIFLFFMIAGRHKLDGKIRRFSTNPRKSGQIVEMAASIDRQIQKYLALKTVISLASGLISMLIIMAFGVRYAILWGFITFVLNYIPNIGSFISKVLPFAFALLQFGRFWPAFWMLAILFVTDAVIGSIIEPRLMGTGLDLSPLAILIALFFWGWMWGVPGMILSVPVIVVMKIISSNIPSMRWFEALLSNK